MRISIVATLVAAIAAVALGLVLVADDDTDTPATTATPSSATTATSATTAPTSTTIPGRPAETETAVFPIRGPGYDTPAAAADAFADAIGFRDPVVGAFQQGDSRSGEIEIRPVPDGPVTTVLVRQLGTDSRWWVLGAATASIQLTDPEPHARIESPVRLLGSSTAFEANVSVEVRQDVEPVIIGTGFVMGGANGEMGPFDGSVTFSTPTSARGSLVLATRSMQDGSTWEATVVRVGFGPVRPTTAFSVFFSGADPSGPVTAYPRQVPRTRGVLRAALTELLAGPTDAERAAGATSWFSSETAGMLLDVEIDNGLATIDFADLREVIPNASASAGSAMLLAQLDATVFQFPTVDAVVYRIAGDADADAFSEWLQLADGEPRARPD